MPSNATHDTHDYAERIRARLPRRLQELREAARLSKYALWQKCGVSREMIGRIEAGASIPTLSRRRAAGRGAAAVPEAAIHRYGELRCAKDKVGFAEDGRIPPPASDAVLAHQHDEAEFRRPCRGGFRFGRCSGG